MPFSELAESGGQAGQIDERRAGATLFHRVEPMPAAQPRSAFTSLPVLGRGGNACDPFVPRSRFLDSDAVFTPSGKSATYLALLDAGVGAGDEVLLPAYHCPTMVHPILALGARPVFVDVEADLTVRTETLQKAASPAARALLLPHFFGLIQPELPRIAQWCAMRGAVLVEDCAHAFYGGPAGVLPGASGDYAIASTRKFFPGSEGGALVANGRRLRRHLPAAPLRDEIRGLFGILEESALYGAFGSWVAGALVRRDPTIGPPTPEAALAEAAPAEASSCEIETAVPRRAATRLTIAIVRRAHHARVAGVRRWRYRRWAEAVEGLPGIAPFRGQLPDELVPYVFPVRLLRPREQFRALRYAGLSIWRWDKIAQSGCRTSERLAAELIQLPCQQSLPDAAFEQQMRAFRRVILEAS